MACYSASGARYGSRISWTVVAMLDWIDIAIRLGIATFIGAAIGLDRHLRGKQTGIRTLGIVALGSALAVVAAMNLGAAGAEQAAAVSRVVQGIVTGIGFLGAGVIVRSLGGQTIRGLTTAACIWLTAAIGILCGLGAWPEVAIALPLAFIVLTFGGPIEKALHARWGRPEDD